MVEEELLMVQLRLRRGFDELARAVEDWALECTRRCSAGLGGGLVVQHRALQLRTVGQRHRGAYEH